MAPWSNSENQQALINSAMLPKTVANPAGSMRLFMLFTKSILAKDINPKLSGGIYFWPCVD